MNICQVLKLFHLTIVIEKIDTTKLWESALAINRDKGGSL